MRYNKQCQIILSSFIIFGSFKQSVQLTEQQFIRITDSSEAAECFRNINRDICANVKKYMSALNNNREESVNTNHVKNIFAAIENGHWNINTLNFENGEIDSNIFNLKPPAVVKEIKLSNNIMLKQSALSIPDNFINNLNKCPFNNNDVTVNNCSAKMNKLCSSAVKCISSNIGFSDKLNLPNNNNNNNINNNNNNVNNGNAIPLGSNSPVNNSINSSTNNPSDQNNENGIIKNFNIEDQKGKDNNQSNTINGNNNSNNNDNEANQKSVDDLYKKRPLLKTFIYEKFHNIMKITRLCKGCKKCSYDYKSFPTLKISLNKSIYSIINLKLK